MKHPRTIIELAICLVIVAAATVPAVGQGPRGGGGAAAGPGTVEQITVHGTALEGNQEGESPDRSVTVYLPPSYAREPARRYPVIYFLHDYGERNDAPINAMRQFADRLAGAQGFSEAIVVTPDANTSRRESMYTTGAAGDWEKFIAEDLVSQIDKQFRTLPTRMSRGLAGHGRGGYGALRAGMKTGDVFASLYLIRPCCLDENGTLASVEQAQANLKKYYAIAIEVGAEDPLFATSRQLHETLTRLRVPHYFEDYAGDPAAMVNLRIERNLLPFFSRNLAAPENPTAPGVK